MADLLGTVAVTDENWYRFLLAEGGLQEVNFWKPSARRTFNAPLFSPFLFKLRAPHNAICGFGYFARFSRLPAWLAWEAFGRANGCTNFTEMSSRIAEIRQRIGYQADEMRAFIGSIIVVQPTFFPKQSWIAQPTDWSPRTQESKKYDLTVGEGKLVWQQCLSVAHELADLERVEGYSRVGLAGPRYGPARQVVPRLGQGAFRVAVTEAYQGACAATGEHSLPALDAAHIQPYGVGGPHEVRNGILFRADLHRLFDKGYLTVTPDLRVEVSSRLRDEYHNGHSYYPLHGNRLRLPRERAEQPDPEFLRWHNERVFAA